MSMTRSSGMARRAMTAIDRAVNENRLIGTVVLVARDGEIIFEQASGYADREQRRPMRGDTLFRLASLSKPIVSAAALAMVERGWLCLTDPVSRWLPEFTPTTSDGVSRPMTVRHLLTHTAGLTYRFLEPAGGPYGVAGISDGLAEPGLSMRDELRLLAKMPLMHAPGAAWGYSLANDVLGEVMNRAAGMPLPAIVRQFVTGPLEIDDLRFFVQDRERLAALYVDANPPRRMVDPDLVPFGDGEGIRVSPSRVFERASFCSGGAGMVGTASDFLVFLESLRRGGGVILEPESAQAMMTNQIGALRVGLEPTPAWGYGFGGAVLVDAELAGLPQSTGTWKWGGVYGHHWYVDVFNRLTVVVLTNTALAGMIGEFPGDLMNAVYGV